MTDATQPTRPDEAWIVGRLTDVGHRREVINTVLMTDQRVLARVTDGIYRQPGSALRELISNAYDADARRVTIRLDRPRYSRMIVDDDGSGMSPEALTRVLHHIGGSAKRTNFGAKLGVTHSGDPTRSPGGRPLIGKIGIGLFSVAQLTQAFTIITKVEGDDFQTVARVILKQFTEEVSFQDKEEEEEAFEAGRVQLWTEPVPDLLTQGTSVILTAIRPQTRDTLRSLDRWHAVFAEEEGGKEVTPPPRFYTGVVERGRDSHFRKPDLHKEVLLPWDVPSGDPGSAMSQFEHSIRGLVREGVPNPSIEKACDYYLQMVWGLSLYAPLAYIDGHPFDLAGGSGSPSAYVVSGAEGVGPRRLQMSESESVREAAGLGLVTKDVEDFAVEVDEVVLRRPLRFRNLAATGAAFQDSLLFVASHSDEFVGVPREISGGPLRFEAYFLAAPKVVPVEHRGLIIRVNQATGMAFDETFLGYPAAERRLSQITCEVFIREGFDGALNIDRESFNLTHSHVRALRKWLHVVLRKVVTEQKRLGSEANRERRQRASGDALASAREIVQRVWENRSGVTGYPPPPVRFVAENENNPHAEPGAYLLDASRTIGELAGANLEVRRGLVEELVASLAQLLAAYDLLDMLTEEDRNELLGSMREVATGLVAK